MTALAADDGAARSLCRSAAQASQEGALLMPSSAEWQWGAVIVQCDAMCGSVQGQASSMPTPHECQQLCTFPISFFHLSVILQQLFELGQQMTVSAPNGT